MTHTEDALPKLAESQREDPWMPRRQLRLSQSAPKGRDIENGCFLSQENRAAREQRAAIKATQHEERQVPDRNNPAKAKDEVVRRKRKSSLLPKYKDKVEVSGFVPLEYREALKAIAAAKDMGIVDYVGEIVFRHVAKNQHLIPIGKEKLKQPKRYKTKRMELEQEVQRLTHLVKKPAPR